MSKKEINTYYCTIELSVFNTAVLVLVSKSRQDIAKDLKEIYSRLKVSKDVYIKNIEMIKSIWGNDDNPDYMPPGETIRLANNSEDVFMFFNADSIADISEELILHETHHASTFICKFRGIDDEECETYVQEFLFNQMLNRIDEWNDKHKNKKK